MTSLDGRIYAASYAGGDLTVYDPAQPWDQWNGKNPRPLARVGPAYIRPTGGIVTGPDGRLYSGWMARYGTYGGAVAITDPATGATQLLENPLGEQAIEGLAVDDRCAYVGTSLAANGLPSKPGETARFGMIELASQQVVFDQTWEGASRIGPIVYEARTRQVALAVDGQFQVFDPEERQFLPGLAAEKPGVGSRSMAAPGDGQVYYGGDQGVVGVDLLQGTFRTLAEVPGSIANVTGGKEGVLYVSCGAEVYRIETRPPERP